MKKLKLLGILLLSVIVLGACSSNDSADSTSSTSESTASENSFATITSGVENGKIKGDSQNFANISGTSTSSNRIFLIDKESGLAHGASIVEGGKFEISCNMQGLGKTELYLSNDDGLKLFGNDTSKLKNKISLTYVPNGNASESSSSSSSQNDNNTSTLKIGESAKFESGLTITVNSVEDSSEEPNGAINGHLVKISFTIENLTGADVDFNSNLIDLYDGQREKAELNAKNFYSETIANGMKSTGSAYYDAINDSPYTVIIGAATFVQ